MPAAAPRPATAGGGPVTLPITVTADAAGRVTLDLGPDSAGRRVTVAPSPPPESWRDAVTPEQRRARLDATVERENARRRAAGLPVAADMTEEEYRASWDRALAAGPLTPPPDDWDEPLEEPILWCDR